MDVTATDIANIETILTRISVQLDTLTVLGCLIFGSLLFVHFGRFMRW